MSREREREREKKGAKREIQQAGDNAMNSTASDWPLVYCHVVAVAL